MKLNIKGLGLCVALAAVLAAPLPSTAATILRIGTVLAPDDPMGQGLDKFKADVAKATKGEVKVEVFHNSQLGDTTEMIDQARAGANVGTVTDVARLSSFVPSLAIMSAPFLFDTYEQADKFALSQEYLGWGEELKKKSQKEEKKELASSSSSTFSSSSSFFFSSSSSASLPVPILFPPSSLVYCVLTFSLPLETVCSYDARGQIEEASAAAATR